ncbi:hypothetical protein BASA81_002459 [Batrachochytrium salamandrivorans]|nr:hypothetical protein BASA81_002459 [Batrachochytrium salamandrivorans]
MQFNYCNRLIRCFRVVLHHRAIEQHECGLVIVTQEEHLRGKPIVAWNFLQLEDHESGGITESSIANFLIKYCNEQGTVQKKFRGGAFV